jgi:NADH:ubiquinone oxidoreductase subunit 6 (subunit J)
MPLILAQSDPDIAHAVLFYALALCTGAGALGVVISTNIVRAAVSLLFSLLGAAGLYFLLNAEFLAAVQVVVYAGGTLILIVFGIMLTSNMALAQLQPKRWEVVLAGVMGAVLLASLTWAILISHFPHEPLELTTYPVDRLGTLLLGDYLIPFELASVLLLAVMIGAAYLAKGRRRKAS